MCFTTCLLLFIACNQGKHLVSATNDANKIKESINYLEKIENLTTKARSLIGRPYKMGSSGPKSFDCSGFTSYIFNSIRITLPRMSNDQFRTGSNVKLAAAKPGDLLFFGKNGIDHVAMITRVKGKAISMIHASTSVGVVEQVLQDSDYWMNRIKGVRRIVY